MFNLLIVNSNLLFNKQRSKFNEITTVESRRANSNFRFHSKHNITVNSSNLLKVKKIFQSRKDEILLSSGGIFL